MTKAQLSFPIDGIYYSITYNHEVRVVKNPYTYKGAIAIPSCITYRGDTYSVTSIDQYAFAKCKGLTSVSIPNSVISIEKYAFYGSSVTSVTIPNSVKEIGYWAFMDCESLSKVHITDLETWCKINFKGYASNPLKYAHHLFLNGKEIKDLVFPNNMETVKGWAFDGCSGLTSVTIPNGVKFIGEQAFQGCSSLKSVSIPNSVKLIDEWAFHDCSGLKTLILGSGVWSIKNFAFYDCLNLKEVYCYAKEPPSRGHDVFGYSDKGYSFISKATLYVPPFSYLEYKKSFMGVGFGTINVMK